MEFCFYFTFVLASKLDKAISLFTSLCLQPKNCEYIYKKIQTIGFSKSMIKHEYFKHLLQIFIL
jgi:hypothetical protein